MMTLKQAQQVLYVLERATHFACSRAFDRAPQAVMAMRQVVALCAAEARDRKNPPIGGQFMASIAEHIAAEREAAYPSLTLEEVKALTAMYAGAPWVDSHLANLADIIAIYERLRAEGKRPVDPADVGVVEVPRAELRRLAQCSDSEMGDGDFARDLARKWLEGGK